VLELFSHPCGETRNQATCGGLDSGESFRKGRIGSLKTGAHSPLAPEPLRLPLATVNQQLHRLALELLVVPFCDLFFFVHGFSLFTLSFRVRKIRGASVIDFEEAKTTF
jgi:hypothetical protein